MEKSLRIHFGESKFDENYNFLRKWQKKNQNKNEFFVQKLLDGSQKRQIMAKNIFLACFGQIFQIKTLIKK